MKTNGFISYKYILYLSCIVVWSFISCNKQDSRVGENLGQVVIRVNGTSYGTERVGINNLKKADVFQKNSEEEIQEIIVPLSNDISIVAKLTPVNNYRSMYDTSNKLGAIVVDPELTQDIVYRVVVYNPDDSYKLHTDFAYGDDATILGLDDQVTYTFIAYSVNTTNVADLPSLNTSESLDDVSIQVDNDNEYLMYYSKQLKVSYNQTNNLDVILDHKFSQITTTVSINMNAYDQGARIKAIDAPTINSERESATLKLSNGTLTYGSLTVGKVLTGDAIVAAGVQSYSFDPVNIISDDVTNAVMSFPSFTISTGSSVGAIIDVNNVNFELANLKITPGHRYSLNLNIIMPCVEKVEPTALTSIVWPNTYGVLNTSSVYTFDSSDYGVEFNIYSLDQSFQLLINNQPIFFREVEFEYYGYDPSISGGDGVNMDDVRFLADDGRYNGAAPPIYDLVGYMPSNSPIVKIIVDVNGNVSLYGSRTSHNALNYILEPLYLVNGNGFNHVNWNNVGSNQVVLRQTSYGPTSISFNVVGYKKVACPQS